MFCPKCGIENPDNGKFCRSCGTDLNKVSKALSGELDDEYGLSNQNWMGDPTGGTSDYSYDCFDSKGKKRSNNPDDLWSAGVRSTIFGFGFLIISMVLFFTNVAGGYTWWWAMLFPGFAMIAGGIGNIVKARRLEGRMLPNRQFSQQNQFPNTQVNNALPPTQTEYVRPPKSFYDTGDLAKVPTSVTENTTRHLEMDSEGETMTLPKK